MWICKKTIKYSKIKEIQDLDNYEEEDEDIRTSVRIDNFRE